MQLQIRFLIYLSDILFIHSTFLFFHIVIIIIFFYFSGHVRDLPQAGSDYATRADLKKIMVLPELKINVADLGVDVRNNFEPVYVPLEGKAETLKRLKKLSEQCSRILLATGK